MKVLSLKEPFATLIKNNKKYIETRSWKTNYRGELYIHASISKIDKNIFKRRELVSLINDDNMNYGYIICKCDLVDCIEMTDDYIKYIEKNEHQQFICGEYKVGRCKSQYKNAQKVENKNVQKSDCVYVDSDISESIFILSFTSIF